YINYGYLLITQEYFDEALEKIKIAETIDNKDPYLHFLLSYIYSKQNSNKSALKESWVAFRLKRSFQNLFWLFSRLIANLPWFVIVILFFLYIYIVFIPLTISFSYPAVAGSILIGLLFVIQLIKSTLHFLSSDKLVRKGKVTITAIFMLIGYIYLEGIFSHWNQPVLSPENFSINVSTKNVPSNTQHFEGQFSFTPPFFVLEPTQSLRLDISINNYLTTKIDCSITNHKDKALKYTQWSQFQAPPGETKKNLTIKYSNRVTEIWIKCQNDLSSLATPIEFHQ
ncbi:MAG TPA: hypothetical protein DCX53_02070, partial [Anaerolineae bacterium]|nr:hypothetical protein [Anaerolineae bacterium]